MLALFLLQTTLSPFISWQTVHPNFLLVAVIALALLKPFKQALGWAVFAGIALDIFSSAPFGIFTIGMVAIAIAANFWYDRFSANAVLLPVALALPYSLLFDTISLITQQLFGRHIGWNSTLLRLVFFAALLNILTMLVIYPFLSWVHRPSASQEFRL